MFGLSDLQRRVSKANVNARPCSELVLDVELLAPPTLLSREVNGTALRRAQQSGRAGNSPGSAVVILTRRSCWGPCRILASRAFSQAL